MREPMISYIFENEFAPESRPTRPNVFSNFLKSNDLNDFLRKVGLTDEKIKEFISDHESVAIKDYEELSEKYKNPKLFLDDEEEQKP
jgi:hypothetical protein